MGAPVHPDGPPSRTDAAVPPDELRPVTALFADIVGSTSLGERLTPAEVKALIGECVSRMSRAVEEFGGTVQAYMGDGICAYFGVPFAHVNFVACQGLAGVGAGAEEQFGGRMPGPDE